jgi:seryl-tRNA synthetase
VQHKKDESFRGGKFQCSSNKVASFNEAFLNKLLNSIREDESGTVNKKVFLEYMVQMDNILRENQNEKKDLEKSNQHLSSEVIKLRKENHDLITEIDALANEQKNCSSKISIKPRKQNLLNLDRCKQLFKQLLPLLNFVDKEFQKGDPDFQAMMLMERFVYFMNLTNDSLQSIEAEENANSKFKQSFIERSEDI